MSAALQSHPQTETIVANACLSQIMGDLPARLTCRLLTPADADTLQDFRVHIVANLPDPDFYRLVGESLTFIDDHLYGDGVVCGVFDDAGTLIAYGALGLPKPGHHNHGTELGLPEAELPTVAHVSSVMVRSDWHRHGLHHRLLNWRLAVAKALGKRHVLTIVSPRNQQSWGHMTAHGLFGKKLVDVGDSLIRVLVHGDLHNPHPDDDPDSPIHLIPVHKLVEQGALFDAGYWLWRRVHHGGEIFAEMRRPAAVTAVVAAMAREGG